MTIFLMAQGPRLTGFVSSPCEWFHLNPIFLSLLPSQFTACAYSLRSSASSSFWLVRASWEFPSWFCRHVWLATWCLCTCISSNTDIGCCMTTMFSSGVIGGCTYNGRNCFSDYNDCYQVRILEEWSVGHNYDAHTLMKLERHKQNVHRFRQPRNVPHALMLQMQCASTGKELKKSII